MKNCVYCVETKVLGDRQILFRGEYLYLCAPLGQIVEGYLVIAPYDCIAALSKMPCCRFTELEKLKAIVTEFYAVAYETAQITFYEQGRGGGGATTDGDAGFPLHAHLCCLPRYVQLDAVLSRDYVKRDLSEIRQLREVARNEPYLYVESMKDASAYVASNNQRRIELERYRLKPKIAALLGLPERGDWRVYPGYDELDRLTARWSNTRLSHTIPTSNKRYSGS